MEYDYHFILSFFHIAIVVTVFLFVGFKRSSTPQWIYNALLFIGCIIFVFHGYKAIIRLRVNSDYLWINMLHVLIIAPIIIFIGYHKTNTPRFAYELLLLLGFAALGYHMFSLINLLHSYSQFA